MRYFLVFFITLFLSCVAQADALSSMTVDDLSKQPKLKWQYDGVIPKQGCQKLNGTILNETTCLYDNKTLHILSKSNCDNGARMPEDHSDHCTRITLCSESGSVLSGTTVIGDTYFPMSNYDMITKFDGDICFIDPIIDYIPYQKKILISLDGIWNEANLSITTDLPVFSDKMVVRVNDVNVPYYSKAYYDYDRHKWLDEIKFALEQSTKPYSVVISNSNEHALMEVNDELLSPYWQLQTGVLPENVLCEEKFVQLFSISTNSPICITQKTADVLIKRGYTIEKYSETLVDLKSFSRYPDESILVTTKSNEGLTYWYTLPKFASIIYLPPPHGKIIGINLRVNDVYTGALVYHNEGKEYADAYDANTETILSFAEPILLEDVQFHFQFSGTTNSLGIRYLYK